MYTLSGEVALSKLFCLLLKGVNPIREVFVPAGVCVCVCVCVWGGGGGGQMFSL